MKKVLAATLVALGLSSVSSAAFIQCFGPGALAEQNVITGGILGSAIFTCTANNTDAPGSITNGDNLIITGIRIATAGTISDNSAVGNGSYSTRFTSVSSIGMPPSFDFVVNGSPVQNLNPPFNFTVLANGSAVTLFDNTINADSLAAFTVTVTATDNGVLRPQNASSSVYFELQITDLNPSPEPSTFVLLGSALTGLGIIARRRKA